MKGYNHLTQDQFNLLSWYATLLHNFEHRPENYNKDYQKAKIDGVYSACSFAGIDDSDIFKVRFDKKYTGLRNYNKLSYAAYWD